MFASGVARFALGSIVVAILLSGVACRLVSLSPVEMSELCYERGLESEASGQLETAWGSYRHATDWNPRHGDAWEARVRLRPDDRSIDDDLAEWKEREPRSYDPDFRRALVAWRRGEFDAARAIFHDCWENAPDPRAILDLHRLRPVEERGWAEAQRLFRSLPVRDEAGLEAERAFVLAWCAFEVGDLELANERGRSPRLGDVERAIVRARRQYAAGDSDAAFQTLEATPGIDRRWEARRLRWELLIRTGDTAAAKAWGDRPENTTLRAAGLLRALTRFASGEFDRAELLREMRRVESPHLRLLAGGILARAALDPRPILREALAWSAGDGALSFLHSLGIQVGAPQIAAEALRHRVELDPDSENVARWQEEIASLEHLAATPSLVPRAWPFFRKARAAERRSVLASFDEALLSDTLAAALGHPDESVRVIALTHLASAAVVEAPETLSGDPSPLVRGAWIVYAVSRGGELAERAVALGREDPDPYVREVAGTVALPAD